jgi:chemotaxis protein MotA
MPCLDGVAFPQRLQPGLAVIAFLGILVVMASVAGGFLLAGGHLAALWQPSEFVVIVGTALGAVIIGQPIPVLKATLAQLAGLPKSGVSRQDCLDLLAMLAGIFQLTRKEGLVALEAHVNNPDSSALFTPYPRFLADKQALRFLLDTLELLISGATVNPHDLETLLELDVEARHEGDGRPAKVLSGVADALPGIGIVAAVLGIIITMQHIGGPPSEIGHHVAAALVGTFLGILLSYGFVQGLSTNLAGKASARKAYLMAQQHVLVAMQRGAPPSAAVEFGRRSLPENLRPSSEELTAAIRARK